jgi:hypothetical protein
MLNLTPLKRKEKTLHVKKIPSAEFTIQWKEIAQIGKRGKHVTCKCKLRHTANREKCPLCPFFSVSPSPAIILHGGSVGNRPVRYRLPIRCCSNEQVTWTPHCS